MLTRESSPGISLVFVAIYYLLFYLFIYLLNTRSFSLLSMTCSRVDKLTVLLTSDICFYFTNRLAAGRLRSSFPWKLNKPLATGRKQ